MLVKRVQGVSLVEVLVAIVVFTTGILGVAGLQMRSLNNLTNSSSLSIAVLAASDMADRIRANSAGAKQGVYNSISGNPENPECETRCSPGQMAERDAYTVMQLLKQHLTNPVLEVSRPSVNRDMYTVVVKWDDQYKGEVEQKQHRFSFLNTVD